MYSVAVMLVQQSMVWPEVKNLWLKFGAQPPGGTPQGEGGKDGFKLPWHLSSSELSHELGRGVAAVISHNLSPWAPMYYSASPSSREFLWP